MTLEGSVAADKHRGIPSNPVCSFCERSEQDLEREGQSSLLIKGGQGYICTQCVDLCTQLIADHHRSKAKGS